MIKDYAHLPFYFIALLLYCYLVPVELIRDTPFLQSIIEFGDAHFPAYKYISMYSTFPEHYKAAPAVLLVLFPVQFYLFMISKKVIQIEKVKTHDGRRLMKIILLFITGVALLLVSVFTVFAPRDTGATTFGARVVWSAATNKISFSFYMGAIYGLIAALFYALYFHIRFFLNQRQNKGGK